MNAIIPDADAQRQGSVRNMGRYMSDHVLVGKHGGGCLLRESKFAFRIDIDALRRTRQDFSLLKYRGRRRHPWARPITASSRSSATPSAALSLSNRRLYVAQRIRGSLSGYRA
jgi:hypothetical protein